MSNDKKSSFLHNYEIVKVRKKRFEADYPNGLIYPMQVSGLHYSNFYVVYMAFIFKDKSQINRSPEALTTIVELAKTITPDNAGIIAGTIGLILGADSTGHSLSMAGGPHADKFAWVENCEESAIGRALDNLGYQGLSCSQEEMLKVQHMQRVYQERNGLISKIDHYLRQLAVKNYDINHLYQTCTQLINKHFNQFYELPNDDLVKIKDYIEQVAQSQGIKTV